MLQQKSIPEQFLDKFTYEIIAIKKQEIAKKHLEEIETARIKRQVEIEKLKQKFSEYGEQKIELKEKIQEKPFEKINPPISLQQKPQLPNIPVFQRPNPPKIIEQKVPEKEEFQRSINIPVPKPPTPTIPVTPEQKTNPKVQQKPQVQITTIPIPPQQPLQEGEIDFGKIRFLIKDPLVTYVECPGVEKNLIIRRAGVTTKTQITLKKEEIINIIKSFSEIARIPLIEGMLNARVSNLEMSAISSENLINSFIVKKNPIPDMNKPITQLQRPMMQIPTMPGVPNILGNQQSLMPVINRPFTAK